MKILRPLLLILSFAAAEAVAFAVPDSPLHQPAKHPYFAILLIAVTVIYFIAAVAGYLTKKKKEEIIEEPLFYRAPFLAGVILFLNLLNIFTVKTAIFPVLYFPSLDRVFGTLAEDRELILKCIAFSMGILVKGVLGGLIVGFFMGLAVGFSTAGRILSGTFGKYIHHRHIRMVPHSGADLQRYIKREELLF